MCSTVDDILPIQSPFSHLLGNFWFQPCTWNKTSFSARRSHLHTHVLTVFRYGVQTIFQHCVSGGTPASAVRTLHWTRRELGLRAVWYDAAHVRSKPCTNLCAFSTTPLDLDSYHGVPVTTVPSGLVSSMLVLLVHRLRVIQPKLAMSWCVCSVVSCRKYTNGKTREGRACAAGAQPTGA